MAGAGKDCTELYNKYHHYKQSNIGIVDEETNLGGVNKVIGSKVFIYFEGDHKKLERELKEMREINE